MSNRLASREIPLFWSHEELGQLRKMIEDWYSKNLPLTSIIKRAGLLRVSQGRRPLIACDIYGALQDAVRRNTITQRKEREDEMAIATFRHFFTTWKNGGSLADCIERVAHPIPAGVEGQPASPKFVNYEACKRLFRQLGERWRSERRGDVQALVLKPRREALAARPNSEASLPHEVATRIAQRIYDVVMAELLPPVTEPAECRPERSAEQASATAIPLGTSVIPADDEDTANEDTAEDDATITDSAPLPAAPPLGSASLGSDDLDIDSLADEDEIRPGKLTPLEAAPPAIRAAMTMPAMTMPDMTGLPEPPVDPFAD